MSENDSPYSHEQRAVASSIDRQASEWLVLLQSGDATDEDRAHFAAWLAEAPGHSEAHAALSETWARLTLMGQRARAGRNVPPRPEVAAAQLVLPARARRRQRAAGWGAAAVLLVAAAFGGMLLLQSDSATPYRTGVGERRTVRLVDGSTVELNTDTELLVDYTDEARRVAMTRGEAFYEVAREPDRPFIVAAGSGAIRALGTGFAVRLKSPQVVSVMVTEGVVEVTHTAVDISGTEQPARRASPPVLQRGQRAEYDRQATRIEEVPPEELERTQSWRRGLLVFEDASLTEVIAEVNRYTETPIVLADPDIGELRLGGTFRTGRLDALLDVLEEGFGIRVNREHSKTIELYAPSTDPAS